MRSIFLKASIFIQLRSSIVTLNDIELILSFKYMAATARVPG